MAGYDLLTYLNVVSFDVYPVDVIGSKFNDVTVLATLDKDSASMYGIDPDQRHVNVYPSLPAGVPDDPDQYQYVKLRQPNGSIDVVGIPWIKEDSITVSSRGTLTIVVEDASPKDLDTINTALAANGFRAAKVTLK